MKSKDILIGLRVRNLDNEMTALVVGRPEHYTAQSSLVRIKYEKSTRYEQVLNHHLEALPKDQQYPVHGGTHTREDHA